MKEMRYYKPKSMAWWASIIPLVGGVVLAVAPTVPVLQPVAEIVTSLAGPGRTAFDLIQIGALGLGIRGAL